MFGSTMAKRALNRIKKDTSPEEVKIINIAHDEGIVQLPGESVLDLENSEIEGDVIIKPEFIIPDRTIELANTVSEIMKEVEEEMFQGMMKGRVEIDIAPVSINSTS